MQTINTRELKDKISRNQDFLLLNVLSEESFNKEHIPGSENVPHDAEDFVKKVSAKAPDEHTEIVVYCASTECPASEKAAKNLKQAGYTNVKDYEEGLKGWKDADYELAA